MPKSFFENAINSVGNTATNVSNNKPLNMNNKLSNISDYGKANNQWLKNKASNALKKVGKSMDESIKRVIIERFKFKYGWDFDTQYYNFEKSIQLLKDVLNKIFVPKTPELAKLLACNHMILVKKYIDSAILDGQTIYANSFKNIIHLNEDLSTGAVTLNGGKDPEVIKPSGCEESEDDYNCLSYTIYGKIYKKLFENTDTDDTIKQDTNFLISKMASKISGREPSVIDYITGNKGLTSTTENSDFLNSLNNAIEYDLKYNNVLKNKSYNRIVKTHFKYYLKRLNMKDLKSDVVPTLNDNSQKKHKGGESSFDYLKKITPNITNKATAGEEGKIDELISKGKEVPPLKDEKDLHKTIKESFSGDKRFNNDTLNNLKEKYERIIHNMISNYPIVEVYMSLMFIYYNINKNVTKEGYKEHRFYKKCIHAIQVILQNIRNKLISDLSMNPFEKKMMVDICDQKIKKTLHINDSVDSIEECIERKILSYYCNTIIASMSHLKAYYQLKVIESLHIFFLKHYPDDPLANVTIKFEEFKYCDDMKDINDKFIKKAEVGGSLYTRRLRSNSFNKTRHVLHSKKRTNRIHKNHRKTKKK